MSSMTTDKKFQARTLKPVADREEQVRMFDSLVNFIKTNAGHLQPPEAKKFFSSVSTTESARIFQFLISRLLPDFKINRLEIEVPEALTTLDYPYIRSVTKSALVSVTTRQAAVGLLTIFDWLIDAIQSKEQSADESNETVDEPDDERGELCKNIVMDPDSTRPDDALFNSLYPTKGSQIEDFELAELEIEKQEEILAEIEQMIQGSQTIDEDIEKCIKYEDQMLKYLETKKQTLEDVRQRALGLEFQGEDRIRLKQQNSLEIKVHELGVEEVKRFQAEMARNDALIENLKVKSNEVEVSKMSSEKLAQRHNGRIEDILKGIVGDLRAVVDSLDRLEKSNSEQCVSRKLILRDWIVKLEQTPHQELIQSHRIMHDFNLLVQKLSATTSSLKSELEQDCITSVEEELRSVVSDTEKYHIEVLPKLLEIVKRGDRDIDMLRIQYTDSQTKVEAMDSALDRKMAQLQERYNNMRQNLEKERASDLSIGERITSRSSEESKANASRLQSIIERNEQRILTIVKEAQREADRWNKTHSISKENIKMVRTVARSFKKRLNLKDAI